MFAGVVRLNKPILDTRGVGLTFYEMYLLFHTTQNVTKWQSLNLRVQSELSKTERDLVGPIGVCWRSKVVITPFSMQITHGRFSDLEIGAKRSP